MIAGFGWEARVRLAAVCAFAASLSDRTSFDRVPVGLSLSPMTVTSTSPSGATVKLVRPRWATSWARATTVQRSVRRESAGIAIISPE